MQHLGQGRYKIDAYSGYCAMVVRIPIRGRHQWQWWVFKKRMHTGHVEIAHGAADGPDFAERQAIAILGIHGAMTEPHTIIDMPEPVAIKHPKKTKPKPRPKRSIPQDVLDALEYCGCYHKANTSRIREYMESLL